jgi:hypothetical protein
VSEHGYGHELFNFQPHANHLYGYAETGGGLDLERLGGSRHQQSIDNVLVVCHTSKGRQRDCRLV